MHIIVPEILLQVQFVCISVRIVFLYLCLSVSCIPAFLPA